MYVRVGSGKELFNFLGMESGWERMGTGKGFETSGGGGGVVFI
jgi:hypothetical protein